MRSLFALAVILLAVQLAFAATGTISGTVVDEHGLPAKGMVIEAWPLDTAMGAGIPQAKADEHGHFAIVVPTGGFAENEKPFARKWVVYPRLESEYYPDLSSKFYTTSPDDARIVEFTSDHQVVTAELKLGTKAGALIGSVTDAATGLLIKPQFEFVWMSDPNNKLGEGTSPNYRILLPANTDIKVTVVCEGYKPWTYDGPVNLGPGQDMRLDIRMVRSSSIGN